MNETTRTEGKRPQKDDGTSTDTEPTPRDAWFELHHFQRDILAAIATHDGVPHGLAIKDQLEAWYDEEVNHGRLYPNLDELVEGGLLAKSEKDKRTNGYALTAQGNDVLAAGADHLDAVRPDPQHRPTAADPKSQPDDAGDVADTVADPKPLDVLQTISGVGRRRAQALINAGYESVGSLREAPVDEIAAVESVSESVAVQIKTDIEPSPTNKAALHSDGGYGVTD